MRYTFYSSFDLFLKLFLLCVILFFEIIHENVCKQINNITLNIFFFINLTSEIILLPAYNLFKNGEFFFEFPLLNNKSTSVLIMPVAQWTRSDEQAVERCKWHAIWGQKFFYTYKTLALFQKHTVETFDAMDFFLGI